LYLLPTYPYFKKEAKKALRKQQRKERAIERELFMKKSESKPDQKTFFQLIRRNHAEVRSKIPDSLFYFFDGYNYFLFLFRF
jgi:hypothetical protein